jgi:hypothetical protein
MAAAVSGGAPSAGGRPAPFSLPPPPPGFVTPDPNAPAAAAAARSFGPNTANPQNQPVDAATAAAYARRAEENRQLQMQQLELQRQQIALQERQLQMQRDLAAQQAAVYGRRDAAQQQQKVQNVGGVDFGRFAPQAATSPSTSSATTYSSGTSSPSTTAASPQPYSPQQMFTVPLNVAKKATY